MKISKLFHWLYAILMLLPAFAIGVTCAYAIFNKNAYQSFNSNEVENINTINSVSFENNILYTYQYKQPQTVNGERKPFSYISLTANDLNLTDLQYSTLTHIYLYSNNRVYFSDYDNSHRYDYDLTSDIFKSFSMITEYQNQLTDTFNVILVSYSNAKLDNVFYYSIDKVQQSPLFNWAYDSFLATPITYITGLFGMATDHIAVMLMSYWLAISVIWLVFDMVMYVPLLVHRWIDKGVLE